MGILILAALILAPLIEIAVFIQVGGAIGLGFTLSLIVATALLGIWQFRAQGLATLTRARSQMERDVMPARELFDAACLLVAGGLLLIPGFVTDALGVLLFIPTLREALRRALARRFEHAARTRVYVDGEEVYRSDRRDDVIDGEYRDVTGEPDDNDDEPRRLPR